MLHAARGDDVFDPRPAIKVNALAETPGEGRFTIAAIEDKARAINAS
jgi:hypothetical protein